MDEKWIRRSLNDPRGVFPSEMTSDEVIDVSECINTIVSDLPDGAIAELLGGYENDINQLFNTMFSVAQDMVNKGRYKLELANVEYLPKVYDSYDNSLKKLSYNYFKVSMLPSFNMGWRNIEWGNLMQIHPYSCFRCQRGSGKSYEFCLAYILWRLWSYTPPNHFSTDTLRNRNLKETCLITNEGRLGRLHLSKIEEEIRSNDLLHEKLLPKGVQGLGKDPMRTKNGAIVHLRSRDSFIRGLHVGEVVVDDFLDKSCIYSAEQREKFREVFYAEIMNIVEPGGGLKVVGTPFHEADLYSDIDKDPAFKSFIYPGIFPDGEILAPERFSFDKLMELKASLGSLVFSREVLVIPVSDGSSIFPWDYLQRAFIGMENVSLVENIESYPVKFEKVAVGCDFAISGNIGADYTVFTVWGRDAMKRYHLLYVWRRQGASHLEQVNQVVWINSVFKPNVIWAEGNNFQSVLIDLIKERGVINIEPFITGGNNKKDLYSGLPSIAALFERGDIKIPYKEGKSKEIAEWLCGEFNSVTFADNGKLESAGEHDDGAMSSFIGISALREDIGTEFRVNLI